MSFKVTILGSNSALPTERRFTTSQIVNIDEKLFMIDCGEGTQIRMRKFRQRFGRLNHIFISHLHGDHYFGLFGLISSMSLIGRTSDLHIYGNNELKNILDYQFNYFKNEMHFKTIFHQLNANEQELIYEDKKITVETIPLKHRVPNCGFLFREKQKEKNIRKDCIEKYELTIEQIVKIKKGQDFTTKDNVTIPNSELTLASIKPASYAFCTDTAYYEKIVEQIQLVDVLYYESTYQENLAELAAITMHSTAKQAATIAQKANVGKLIIGHFSERYKDVSGFLDEAKTVFPNVIVAEDGLEITIE